MVAIELWHGVLTGGAVRGTLYNCCRDRGIRRASDADITLLKSVGSAAEDRAAATVV
jgi:ornithine cyclodeaminase/alanine dehydrogenase-like protein (mu-crystallin family)